MKKKTGPERESRDFSQSGGKSHSSLALPTVRCPRSFEFRLWFISVLLALPMRFLSELEGNFFLFVCLGGFGATCGEDGRCTIFFYRVSIIWTWFRVELCDGNEFHSYSVSVQSDTIMDRNHPGDFIHMLGLCVNVA